MGASRRAKCEVLRAQLEIERSSFTPHWRDLGDYILPRRPRFYTSDVNKGDRRNQKIINSTATQAAKTLRSGMMGGVTSPARPWFRLAIADPEISEAGAVKEWLHIVSDRMSGVFIRSNLYNVLPIIYGDLGVFGTAAMFVEEDFENIIRYQAMPIGSYSIANSDRGKVEVFFREFRMTVRQIIQKFGRMENGKVDWSNISMHVKGLYESHALETWVDVCHVILPNDYFDGEKLPAKFKRFSSIYYEKGTCGNMANSNYLSPIDDDLVLRESGYDYFPVLAPRWEVTGEDVYGTGCPGMDALGDIKQLQLGERRLAQAVEIMVKPAMKGPTTLKTAKSSILPGDMTYVDEQPNAKYEPVYQIDPRVNELKELQMEIADRINRAFHVDLIMMMSNLDRRDITAREIDERREEKLLALGPVLEQLNQDLLDPLIDITFDFMVRQGLIPPAPEEIRGKPLRVEYLSVMAQAQKLAGISAIERFAGFVNQLVAVVPGAIDKVDVDQLIDVYADITSQQPGIVRDDDTVMAIREQAAKVKEQQARAEMMAQGAKTARDLSSASLDGNSALNALIEQSQAGQMVS